MRIPVPAALRLALLAVWMAIPAGCPQPLPPPGTPGEPPASPGIFTCTVAAVRDHALVLLPAVNDCLTAPAAWEACLLSLIKPAEGITEEVLACAVQGAGRHAAAAADANSKDQLSSIEAERARAFIKSHGYVFSP